MSTVEFRHYRIGVLTATSFLANYYDQPGIAAHIVRELLTGETIRTLQRVARVEGLSFPLGFWQEDAFRSARR